MFNNMNFLYYQHFMLRLIGYTFQDHESLWLRCYAISAIGSMGLIMVPLLHFVLANIADLPLATNALCSVFTFAQTVQRFTQINIRIAHFYDLWNQIVVIWQKGMKSSFDRPILLQAYKTSHILVVIYIICGIHLTLAYNATPLLMTIYQGWTSGSYVWTLPFPTMQAMYHTQPGSLFETQIHAEYTKKPSPPHPIMFNNMKFLYYQHFMLRLIGYTFQDHESLWLRSYAISAIASMGLIMVPLLHFVLANIADLPLATNALCLVFTFAQTLQRFTRINICIAQFYDLWNQIVLMWQKGMKSSFDRPILLQAYKTSHILVVIYIICGVHLALAYNATPLLVTIYHGWTSGSYVWTLPFPTIFLYDIDMPILFFLTYFWMILGSLTILCGLVALDAFFYAATFTLAGHCRVIQQRLGLTMQHRSDRAKYMRIRKLIVYHQTVLSLSQDLVDLFGPMLVNQLLLSSIHICVIAYQLTLSLSFVDTVRFVIFLSALLFQCFLYCNAGSQITSDSLAIDDAVYNFDWYATDRRTNRLIQLFMMRAQKPIAIRAGVFEANLATFSSMISSAGSYITLLQTMTSKAS